MVITMPQIFWETNTHTHTQYSDNNATILYLEIIPAIYNIVKEIYKNFMIPIICWMTWVNWTMLPTNKSFVAFLFCIAPLSIFKKRKKEKEKSAQHLITFSSCKNAFSNSFLWHIIFQTKFKKIYIRVNTTRVLL